MPTSVVDVVLRVAALALAGQLLAAVTWRVTEPRVVPALPAAPARTEPALVRAATFARTPPPVAEGSLDRVGLPAERPRTNVLDTPFGRFEYVRAMDVLTTYYTPANGGKAPGSAWYGITATGARATRGVVAVDPRVVPLYSWVYVPGYGVAQARDVGGAVIGDHIDVAFDDGDGAWWGRRYLTVYILAR